LARVETYLAPLLDGRPGWNAGLPFDLPDGSGALEREIAALALDAVVECLAEADENRVVTGGVSALFSHPELAQPAICPTATRVF